MIDTDKIYKEWCKVRNLMFDKGVEVYDYRDLDEYISNLLAEVKRLRQGIEKLYADINSISLKKDALMNVIDAFDTSIPTVLTSIKELHKGKEMIE